MYPNLSYIFEALFGTEPDGFFSIFQTFGLFLGLAFAASAYFLYKELKRKEEEGILHPVPYTHIAGKKASALELTLAGIVGFLLGFKVLYLAMNFSEVKGDMFAFIFSSKGVLIGGIFGAALNVFWAWYEKNKYALPIPKEVTTKQFPHERIMDFTFVGFIGGYYYTKKVLKIKPIHVMDAIAPALIMGYAVGRLGCQFSGDGDWGIDNDTVNPYSWLPDWMWSTTYPHNVLNEGIAIPGCEWEYCSQLATPVYPTPIYEVIMALIIFAILWSLRKRIKVAGVLFFIYMIFNGVERFWIEKIRVNKILGKIGNIEYTQAELIAVLFVITGIAGIAILYSRAKKQPPLATA